MKGRDTKEVPPHVHGTRNGYGNHGCRCGMCKALQKEFMAEARERRYGQRVWVDGQLIHPSTTIVHGKYTTYFNYGCHCGPCRDARKAYYADLAARKRKGPL